jgi:hypothetical protein
MSIAPRSRRKAPTTRARRIALLQGDQERAGDDGENARRLQETWPLPQQGHREERGERGGERQQRHGDRKRRDRQRAQNATLAKQLSATEPRPGAQ